MDIKSLLQNNEILVLFLVIGLGYLIGHIKIKGINFGVAAVLFVGILIGAWLSHDMPNPLQITPQIKNLGLILFVYVIGINSANGFFASFKKRGIKYNIIVVLVLLFTTIIAFVLGFLLKINPAAMAGVFCGGLTNTPALGALSQLITKINTNEINNVTIGYSIAYPFSVLIGLVLINIFYNLFKSYNKNNLKNNSTISTNTLVTQNFIITNSQIFEKTIGELCVRQTSGVIISRVKHNDSIVVPTKYTVLHKGDIVVTVGNKEDMIKAEKFFGKISSDHPEYIRDKIDYRRIIVSNKALVGKKIEDLELDIKFNAQIVRLKRADVEIVPEVSTVLELGDRLRVVMPVDKIEAISKFFGDSIKGVAELDYTAIMLGIALGVFIGMIPIKITNNIEVSLGLAGGSLISGLILGRLMRTGPFTWSIPLEASQALSDLGILLFLAAVGISAGPSFWTLLSHDGYKLILLGIIITTVALTLTLISIYLINKDSVADSLGVASSVQTQPATLSCAYDITKSNNVFVAYATVYPISMLGKIILAQILYILASYLYIN